MLVPSLVAAVAALAGLSSTHLPPTPCAALADLRLPHTTITAVQAITDGRFTVPGTNVTGAGLPPFCRVVGVIAPTADSHIDVEVWLPLDTWNHKFSVVGNAGWAGSIGYNLLGAQIKRGYATASTNTGHDATPGGENAARFAFLHPEQLVDFASRAYHETTVQGKAITAAFYGEPPKHSYWIGCSSGGCEGLMEAQRFPADFDGIVAGAPANNFTHLMAGDFDAALAVLQNPASTLDANALALLGRGALRACDAKDGVTDGVIEDPSRCTFDPATLLCRAAQAATTCLTQPQVDAARRVHRGVVDPTSGATIYPGLAVGGEPGWQNRTLASAFTIPISYFRWLVFSDSTWNWTTFDFSRPADFQAYERADAKYAPVLNAVDPDLREFRRLGGKLLMYHGWIDQLISPQNSINYYESVVSFFGTTQPDHAAALRDVQSFYRLFMVPGMGHCTGGPGPTYFDMQGALEAWVERGVAPDSVIGSHLLSPGVTRTRPLCPYPRVAAYRGTGSTDDAASFTCRDP